jgi:DNA invertase Pin-like site-specific DNA recombinase
MTRIGYARVSTTDQNLAAQTDKLTAAGCERIFADQGVSGKLASRPEWDACLGYLRAGDALVITKLDRAGRSVRHLVEMANKLADMKVDLVVTDQGIDTTTPAGKLTFHILAAISEFERDLIADRTKDGLAAARARGRKGGRRPVLTDTQRAEALRLYNQVGPDGKRAWTVADIAARLKCSRPTVYAAVERERAKAAMA